MSFTVSNSEPKKPQFRILCSWCGKLKTSEGWVKAKLQLLDDLERAPITHSMCDQCYDKAMAELQ